MYINIAIEFTLSLVANCKKKFYMTFFPITTVSSYTSKENSYVFKWMTLFYIVKE